MTITKKFSKTRKNSFRKKNKNKTKKNKSRKSTIFLRKGKNGSNKNSKINSIKGGAADVYAVVEKKSKTLKPVVPSKIKNPYVEEEEKSYRFNPFNNKPLSLMDFRQKNNNDELPPPPIQPRKPSKQYNKPLPTPIRLSDRYTKPLPTPKPTSIKL